MLCVCMEVKSGRLKVKIRKAPSLYDWPGMSALPEDLRMQIHGCHTTQIWMCDV